MPAAEVILQLQNQASPELRRTAVDAQTLAAAESRAALAAGDLNTALRKQDEAIGGVSGKTKAGTAETLAMARSEATAAAAVGDHASAINILQAELATQTERTRGVIAAEGQLNALSIREADTAIRVAQAQARASIATKDYAGALEVLNAAKAANADGSALAVASLETQIAQTEAAGTATGAFGAQLGALVNPAALATIGITALVAAAKGAIDLAEAGAQAQRTAVAFDNLAARAGASGDAILIALRKASGGEISDLNLQLAATKAEFTGVATSADDFGRLMAIARNNGREFGLSTADAFDKLIDSLDRGQTRGLKQIGILVDQKQADLDYARSIGTTVAALDEEQKRQALVQATLAAGEAQIRKTGGAASDNAAQFERLGATASNVGTAVGGFLAIGLADAASKLNATADATSGVVHWFQNLVGTTEAIPPAATAATIGVLRSADADDRAAAAAIRHAAALVKETDGLLAVANATGLADQRKGEQTGSDLSAGELNAQARIAAQARADKAAADKQTEQQRAAESQRFQGAQDALNLQRAKTSAQKIAELQRQQRATTDPADVVRLQTQIEQERDSAAKAASKTRVSAAQSTALRLQNVEENSQAALLKAQREGQERLRDQQQDFDLKRSRSQEDEDRKIRNLLEHGQKAAADRERADFARQRKRDQEDFTIQRGRTLRNNAESTGDIGASAARRSDQIGDRAALRGVRAGGATSGGGALPSLPSASATSGGAPIRVTVQAVWQINGKAFATSIWPDLEPIVDTELANALASGSVPNAGQRAVGGAG